jgi:type II secretory pathway pseudopilin PulG
MQLRRPYSESQARMIARPVTRCSGITVLELLVVIGIIVALSALAVPAIRSMTRSNTVSSANRQLLDDLALARQRAINDHSVVRVVFVPPEVTDETLFKAKIGNDPGSERDRKVFTNILTGGLRRYALYAERTAGDQPGRHTGRYLTSWRTLPDGTFIPEWQLAERFRTTPFSLVLDPVSVPFPTSAGLAQYLPHISFDYSGGVVKANGARKAEGEFLYLARGSVLFSRDSAGNATVDARENPLGNSTNNYNRVRIDGLTGRARIERPEIE